MSLHGSNGSEPFPETARANRPPFRPSDLWKAPLHDLPIRDEILFQYMPLTSDLRALEVGPGSGYTAFRVSRRVQHLTVVDVGADNVALLRENLAGLHNVTPVCADLCDPGFPAAVGGPFDAVWAIEVFEFLPEPRIAMMNLGAMVRPGGTFLLQFPNYPPSVSPGPTHYETREAFDAQMREAGFSGWEVYSIALRPRAQWLYQELHEKPINFYRRLRVRRGEKPVLTYDETWAFRKGRRLSPYRTFLHAAWGGLVASMRLGGAVFERTLLGDDIFNKNLLILAKRHEARAFVLPALDRFPPSVGTIGQAGSPARTQTYRLEPLTNEEAERWDDLTAGYETRELFHRRTWLNYLARSRGAKIHLWKIRGGGQDVGYFCAGLVRKGPFKILGSPLRGWGTNSMGPVVHRDVQQEGLLDAFDGLCRDEGIAMAELENPLFKESGLRAHGFEPIRTATYIVDLSEGVDAIWRGLHCTCRNRIRKAQRLGLKVEVARESGVADEFYEQYGEVMRRKGLVPPYPREVARQLVEHLGAADLLFALRVRDEQGRLLATGLFPHDERTVYFWGGASLHDGRDSCPNELMHWHLMGLAAARGITRYNMCGDGRFKRKFGGTLVSVSRWLKYYRPGARLAHRAYELYLQTQFSVRGRLQGLRGGSREGSSVPVADDGRTIDPEVR